MITLTERMLLEWGGERKYLEARRLLECEVIEDLEIDPPFVRGTLRNSTRTLRTGFRIVGPHCVESLCPCYENRERGIVCSHVIALALEVRRRLADPDEALRREEEQRRAAARQALPPAEFLRRAGPGEVGVPAGIDVEFPADWSEQWRGGRVRVRPFARLAGRRVPLGDVPRNISLALPPADDSLLVVLEDIGAGARSELELGAADLLNLFDLRRSWPLDGGAGRLELRTDERLSSRLTLDMDPENGELILSLATPLPEGEVATVQIVAGRRGWAGSPTCLRPLAALLPEPLRALYAGPVRVPRLAVPQFLQVEWPRLAAGFQAEAGISADMLDLRPASPVFHLHVRGSLASLSATLYAVYDGTRLVAGKSDPAGRFAIPDPDDVLRFRVRNPAAEAAGLARLARAGMSGEVGDRLSAVMGERAVLNFLAREVPALRRIGWKVTIEGRAASAMEEAVWATPVVQIRPAADGRTFEVDLRFEDSSGAVVPAAEIRRAMLKGESCLSYGGRLLWFDAGAVEAIDDIFADCGSTDGSRPGTFRLHAVHAAYVRDALHALDGTDIEAPPSWLEQAARAMSGRAAANDASLVLVEPPEGVLRPYQREGVEWLRSLERCGFAGILADDMGLGKTVQTLAWLRLERLHPDARGRPSLIVCPTSLIENWAEEAARFTPSLRVRIVAGAGRHEVWDRLDEADLLITSYALLRRDLDRWRPVRFAVVVLDEAQHIKNRSTKNAIAAKGLQAVHRLVLTGTPMENSVGDLWSIMDFLMPGYLGPAEAFRQRYEQPIAQGGDAGEAALVRLRRKLRPFLLRRLKRDVARDLPPKIERTAWCTLTPDQIHIYREIHDASRRRIRDLVAERGFDAARMEILRTLLRLRQVCCHLDLLRLPDARFEAPSAKMDLLFELLDEAVDGGHRALIFSQFVSMLSILRAELDRRGLRYAYLDGATQDRLEVTRRFNSDRGIPVFLISLKAGGTGLNLVGADTVILYDPWWNPAVENQAIDRTYRIGQVRTVYSVRLIARGTVEERVVALQERKRRQIEAAVQAGGAAIERMSWEDVREILEL